MKVAILDTGTANIRSIHSAIQRLGVSATITSDPLEIACADKVILPGVGHAGHVMERLRACGLDAVISRLEQPLLGICLGMQLLASRTDEGPIACIGRIPGLVQRLDSSLATVPHTGWNQINECAGPLFVGIPEGTWMYFVHSYAAPVDASTTAVCMHGLQFSAARSLGEVHGVQFHPERSGDAGFHVLKNFLQL